jgi:hypothetical protein
LVKVKVQLSISEFILHLYLLAIKLNSLLIEAHELSVANVSFGFSFIINDSIIGLLHTIFPCAVYEQLFIFNFKLEIILFL